MRKMAARSHFPVISRLQRFFPVFGSKKFPVRPRENRLGRYRK